MNAPKNTKIYYTVRIKPIYWGLCEYLECKAKINGSFDELHNEIFIFSMNNIETKGLHSIPVSREERLSKNFYITPKTKNEFHILYKKLKIEQEKLLKGDLVEQLLYIYAIKKLTNEEKKILENEFNLRLLFEK